MSKLPVIQERDITQGGNVSPPQIVVADTTAVPKATEGLGQQVMRTADAVGEYYMRKEKQENNFNFGIAESKFLQRTIGLQNQLREDPDFANLPMKYKDEMAKIKQETIGSVKLNPEYKAFLQQKMDLVEEKGFGNIAKIYNEKQQSFRLSEVDKAVEGNFEAFSRTNNYEEKIALLNSTKLSFANAIPDSDPDKLTKIQEFNTKIEQRAAELDLMQKSPSQRIQMLEAENRKQGSNISEYLTPEKRIDLLDKAKAELKAQQKEYEANLKKAQKQDKMSFDDQLADYLAKGYSFDELPYNVQLKATKLDQTRYNNLRKDMQIDNKIAVNEKEKKFQQYEDIYVNNPQAFADISKAELIANVPSDKREIVAAWQAKAREKMQPDVVLKQRNDIKNTTLRSVGIKEGSNPGIKFKQSFDENVKAFYDENKRQPNAAEAQKIANSLVARATFDGTFFDKEKYLFEDDVKDIVVPEDFSNKIVLQAQRAGMPPLTEDQIRNAYIKKIKNGR